LWAYNNPQAEIDHAYGGMHATTLASKSIVERYYGRAARQSYFIGSSTGGRLAMMAAQRFPWDFDGIIAGVPSLSVTGIHMNLLWGNRVFTDDTGQPLLTQADLDALHARVMATCDLNDGVEDGLIGDPRDCAFDPAQMRCVSGAKTRCLSEKQIDVVRKIYAGAQMSKGKPIYMAAALRGSEHTWLDWFSTLFSGNPRGTYNFVREEFRYGAFRVDPGPTWKPEDFDFDRDPKRLGMADALIDAVNPDLRRFKAAGGKLIAYAGWSDAAGMTLHAVDYYETVERTMGGREQTQDFFRLFTIPGMEHGGGEGAHTVDWLTHLEAWVEEGQPPERPVGFHIRTEDLDRASPEYNETVRRRGEFPLDASVIKFARPIYPYPVVAKYFGRGDPNDAASFGPVDPAAADSLYTRSRQ
jgi:feruloyl esterase